MKILAYRTSQKPGFLQGHCDIEFQCPWGIMQVHNVAILQKNGSRWASWPQRSTGQMDDKGMKEYIPIIQLSERFEQENFQRQLFPLLDAYIMTNAGPSVHQPAPTMQELKTRKNEVPF